MNLFGFADQHGVDVVIRRYPRSGQRYVAFIEGLALRTGVVLNAEIYGEGLTTDEALARYAEKISGKRVMLNILGRSKETTVPLLDVKSEAA